MEKISIVIPAYNAEETIEQAVNSVLIQNVPKEIIVVDDGSADRTPEILKSLAEKHPEIRVITQENAGVSAARNTGIAAATGKWLMTLDDDDYIDGEMPGTMAEAAEKNRGDLVLCGMKLQFEDHTECFSEPAFTADRAEFLGRKMAALYDKHLLTTHSNKLYDLDLIRRENLRYDEQLQINEDIDFVFRYLYHAARIVLLEEPYLNYVQHAAGKSLITTFRKNGVRSSLLLVRDLERLYASLEEEKNRAAGSAEGGPKTAEAGTKTAAEGTQTAATGDINSLKEDMDRRMLVHILSFAGLMYYRSGMKDGAIKEEIDFLAADETFRRLLKRTKPEDMKTLAAKLLLSARMTGFYHALCRRMYRDYH